MTRGSDDRDYDGADRGGGCVAVATVAAMLGLLIIAGVLASRSGLWAP